MKKQFELNLKIIDKTFFLGFNYGTNSKSHGGLYQGGEYSHTNSYHNS